MSVPRAVLDTNALISALVFRRGSLACLRVGWQTGRFVPVLCRETTAELLRVLAYPKFRLELNEINTLLTDLVPWAETFRIDTPGSTVEGLNDHADEIFVHLARQAETDYLVSGDGHLQALRATATSTEILTPAEFIEKLRLADMQRP